MVVSPRNCVIMQSNKEGCAMPKTNFIQKMAEQLSEILPSSVQACKKDFEKNCHGLLSKTFAKLDLVSREEFDAQSKVLLRTRKKLEALEEQFRQKQQAKKSHTSHRDDK